MKQSMKLAARVLENLPIMSPDVMQGWIDNPKALQDFLVGLAPAGEKPPPKPKRNRYLNHIGSATIAPPSGGITISQANDVFAGYLHPDFTNWGTDVVCEDTVEQLVDIYEMKKDGDCRTLFGSLSTDPRSLRLSQGQIVEFCKTHSDLLRQQGYGTFFLFEVKNKLYVADVRVGSGALEVYVSRFVHGHVWSAGFRFRLVVPQQIL